MSKSSNAVNMVNPLPFVKIIIDAYKGDKLDLAIDMLAGAKTAIWAVAIGTAGLNVSVLTAFSLGYNARRTINWINGVFSSEAVHTPDELPHCNPRLNLWNDAENAQPTPPRHYDPLVLDLNRDGKINLDNATFFDLNASGFHEYTRWISETDAFLVLDINGNGKIDASDEIIPLAA